MTKINSIEFENEKNEVREAMEKDLSKIDTQKTFRNISKKIKKINEEITRLKNIIFFNNKMAIDFPNIKVVWAEKENNKYNKWINDYNETIKKYEIIKKMLQEIKNNKKN